VTGDVGRYTSIVIETVTLRNATLWGPLIGIVLLSAIALRHGEPVTILWILGEAGLFIGLTQLPRIPILRKTAAFLIPITALAIAVYVLLAGNGLLPGVRTEYRASLFTDNPNLLGATLAMLGVSALTVGTRHWRYGIFLLVIPAIMLTGSRTAVLAMVAAGIGWTLRPRAGRFFRIATVIAVLIAGAGFLYVERTLEHERTAPNLLRYTERLDVGYWGAGRAETTRLSYQPLASLLKLGAVYQIEAQAGGGDAVLLQRDLGASGQDTPYVAAVDLRANEPMTVELHSNLASVTCEVSRSWSRCVTPAARGNGEAVVQFRLVGAASESPISIQVHGPQVERGEVATPYASRDASPVPTHLLSRYSWSSFRRGDPARLRLAYASWDAFVESPLIGYGQLGVAEVIKASDPELRVSHLRHTHNFLLERLVAEGLVGLLAWLAWFVPSIWLAIRINGGRILSLAAALAVLNLADMTFFYSGSYIPMALSLGILGAASLTKQEGDTEALAQPAPTPEPDLGNA